VGIRIALETIQALASMQGLRGFAVSCDGDPDAALEVIRQAGVRI